MKKHPYIGTLLAVGLLATGPSAGAAEPADSPNYAKAYAHAPYYADRTIWPAWVEKTDFVNQKWPKARVLFWAHAGAGGRQRLDLADPENWRLADGTPAKTGPDEHTDVVFPAGRYHVGGKKGCNCRHMTVEAGVGAFLKTIRVYGNLWIKKGGNWHQIHPKGSQNTFMRNDSPEVISAANKIALNKPPTKSIEWIGDWKLGDELDVFSGRWVVSPGSTFMPGDRSRFHIYPKATLELMSGSRFHKRDNQYWAHDMEVQGTVLAGTPKRPLTKDATLGLCFKAKGNGRGRKEKGAISNTQEGELGLLLYKEGRIAVHSVDPEKARLVIRWRGFGEKRPGKEHEHPDIAAMPHGIDMLLLGKTDFDGVEFRHVLPGGIRMPDPSVRRRWKHVTFGEGNFAEPDKLFARYTGPMDLEMRDTGVAKGLAKEAKQHDDAGGP